MSAPAGARQPDQAGGHFACDREVEIIGLGLLERSLPKADWTHAAHLAAAAWLIAVRTELDAACDMPDIIRAYNLATGVQNTASGGYHDTITQASLRAVRAFLAEQAPTMPLHMACNRLLASPYGDKGWLLRYWSPALLFSAAARQAWVAPDLQELPF